PPRASAATSAGWRRRRRAACWCRWRPTHTASRRSITSSTASRSRVGRGSGPRTCSTRAPSRSCAGGSRRGERRRPREPRPMTNEDVARVFREMADLTRLDAGEPHRPKAFERTAEIRESLPEPASELLRFGRLSKVRGIGPGSVDRIKEILKTGTCAEQRLLRARVPVGLRDVLGMRNMGPALVRQLWQTLGVVDVPGLEAALASGRLRRVPGIGPRTVELIAQSLAHEKLQVRRLLLPEALALGEQIRV